MNFSTEVNISLKTIEYYTQLMAVGDSYYAEYLDLSGKNKTCQSLPDFVIEDDSVGIYINDQPFVCGGNAYHSDTQHNIPHMITSVSHFLQR